MKLRRQEQCRDVLRRQKRFRFFLLVVIAHLSLRREQSPATVSSLPMLSFFADNNRRLQCASIRFFCSFSQFGCYVLVSICCCLVLPLLAIVAQCCCFRSLLAVAVVFYRCL